MKNGQITPRKMTAPQQGYSNTPYPTVLLGFEVPTCFFWGLKTLAQARFMPALSNCTFICEVLGFTCGHSISRNEIRKLRPVEFEWLLSRISAVNFYGDPGCSFVPHCFAPNRKVLLAGHLACNVLDSSMGISNACSHKADGSDLHPHTKRSPQPKPFGCIEHASEVHSKRRNFIRVHYDFTHFQLYHLIASRNKALNRMIKAHGDDEARAIQSEEWLPLVKRVQSFIKSLKKGAS
jgi:hypothetical protein